MVNLRFCIPRAYDSLRGAGLGNEFIAYAKAFIASRALNFNLLHPAWGLNKREYYHYFGTSRLDWLGYKALDLCLPSITFTREDYVRTGKRDYEEAIKCFAEEKGLSRSKAIILYAEGLWADSYEIKKAFGFVWQELYKAKGVAENLSEIEKQVIMGNVRIAVHIRRGDFKKCSGEAQDIRGYWNKAIPIDWYTNVCLNLKKAFCDRVSFILLTDGTEEEVREFTDAIKPIVTTHQQYRDCSDLLIAALADILVCSISSFSMWAARLSNKPYIWYNPHLRNSEGYLTIWGSQLEDISCRIPEAKQRYELMPKNGLTAEMQCIRGIPLGRGGIINSHQLDCLMSAHRSYVDEFDLIMHGAVPEQLMKGV